MLGNWYENTMFSLTVITIFLQVYILYLIRYKSPKSISEYSYFLNMLTVYDLMFNVGFGILLAPHAIYPFVGAQINGLAVYMGMHYLYSASFTFYCGVTVVGVQTYSLIYRYLVLQDNKNVYRIFMSSWCKFICFLIGQAIAVMFSWLFYQTLFPEESIDYRILHAFYNKTIPNVQPGAKMIIINVSILMAVIFLGVVSAAFITIETICVMLLVMILSKLREDVNVMSRSTHKLHKQFTMLLLFQLLTPLLCIFIPVIGFIICVYYKHQNTPLNTDLGILGFSVYGLLNSLLTIFFVSPYRKHFLKVFVEPWWKPLIMLFGKRTLFLNNGLPNAEIHRHSNTDPPPVGAPSVIPNAARHRPATQPSSPNLILNVN